MANDSSDAGKVMTKLLARTYNAEYEMNGSVTEIDKSFNLGTWQHGRYIPSGRSSKHFHGEKQVSTRVFRDYARKLYLRVGRVLTRGLRLYKIMRAIEDNKPLQGQLSAMGFEEKSVSRALNIGLVTSPCVGLAVQPILKQLSTMSDFQFLNCSLISHHYYCEFIGVHNEETAQLLGRAFIYECMTTRLKMVHEEFHSFLVKHVFPAVSSQSKSSLLAKYGETGFLIHAKNLERLYESFDKFLNYQNANEKKEFILRLCFADMDELLADIEWHMNTADSYDHKTKLGIGFVFIEMGFSFKPPHKLVWSAI